MDTKKIICFGDSLTEGWVDKGNSFQPYTIRLQDLISQNFGPRYEVVNCGVSGERIYLEMFKRLSTVLQSHDNIQLLILQGGTNDILTLNELKQSLNLFKELKKLIAIAISYGVPRVCLLTTMEGFYTEADGAIMSHEVSNQLRLDLNIGIRSLTDSNVLVCDIESHLPMFALSEDDRKMMWDDKIHPSVKGYEKMAEIIFDHVRKLL